MVRTGSIIVVALLAQLAGAVRGDILDQMDVYENYPEEGISLDLDADFIVGISGGREDFSVDLGIQKTAAHIGRNRLLYAIDLGYHQTRGPDPRSVVSFELPCLVQFRIYDWLQPDAGIGMGYVKWHEARASDREDGGAVKTFYALGSSLHLTSNIGLRVAYQKDYFIAGRGFIRDWDPGPGQSPVYQRAHESVTYRFFYRF